jgi:GH15 family glucan-1,4-alpha-glucosidase
LGSSQYTGVDPHATDERRGRYPEIADHGIIGDLETAALVATDGTIDFLCLPSFDSPTVFARLLDADAGGHFSITLLSDEIRREQRYIRDTNVLVTRLIGRDAEIEVTDFMPVDRRQRPSRIVRHVRAKRGPAVIRCVCAPRFDYARARHEVTVEGGVAILRGSDGAACRLTATVPLRADGNDVVAELTLQAGKEAAFALELVGDRVSSHPLDLRHARRALRQTVVFWRRWIGKSRYRGFGGTAVRRSALTLKLLQSRRTGAIVAAPTFGLPEQIGGERNWDFRYAWIRDASYAVFALGRIGLVEEARAFGRWVADRCAEAPSLGALQSLYRIDGVRDVPEQVLDHLEGYRGSRPVRVGNAAYDQLQLDIYGELMDALYQRDEHFEPTSRALWNRIVELTEWVCGNWRRPDQGIWEVRGGGQDFLYSRVMCWVAVDRAIRIGRRRRFPAPGAQWREVREAIRSDVDEHFWNESIGAYVGVRGGDAIDAACLVMPLVDFIAPTDSRWRSTLMAVESRLVRDGLVRRYDMAGIDTNAGHESAPAFTVCSFWYVECLARMGEREKARTVMERLLGYGNHVGLFAEDLESSGEQRGNFPQGLSHCGLIAAAVGISRSGDREYSGNRE